MKKQLLVLSLLTCIAVGSGFAQSIQIAPADNEKGQRPPMKPEEKAEKEANKAEKELTLSPEQKVKWQQAALIRIQANQPLVQKMQGSTTPDERKQLKSDMRTNSKTFDSTVNAMLSTSQQEKWNSMKENKKAEMHKKGKHKNKSTNSN